MRFEDPDQPDSGSERIESAEHRRDENGGKKGSRGSRGAGFRFLGLGTELAGFTLAFAGLGYLIDMSAHFPKPYATAAGSLMGFTLGMIRFVVQVRRREHD